MCRSPPPAILLMGPTAAGKTELALALVERLPCEIISVDSALVYRGLDIGTAKPNPDILARAPHRLIDIRDPAEPYSAAQFRADALAAMAQITAAGRVPLLVGGTGLYFRALTQGLAPLPSADTPLRQDLNRQLQHLGSAPLHRWLAVLDPPSAARIHANDPQRILRALEVYLLTGQPLSWHWAQAATTALPYRVIKLALAPRERALLHARIARRFHSMLEAGFQGEVERLRARGDLHPELPALRAVGYRQMWRYLAGASDYSAMVEQAITATRQLAKRQLTWLRAEPECQWIEEGPQRFEQALRRLSAAFRV